MAFVGCVLFFCGGSALGEELAVPPAEPPVGAHVLVDPDARRFLAPPSLSYWAGTERIFDGELSPATPRPFDETGLLPALDPHLSTSAYLHAALSAARHGEDATVVEMSSLQDMRFGAVFGASFRIDAREQAALQGTTFLAVPLPRRLWLLSTFGVGANTDFAPLALGAVEIRTDRSKSLGFSLAVEYSSWTNDRGRALATAGSIWRLARNVALEERIGVGAWTGPGDGGELALRWITAALQTLGPCAALYERVTLARGPLAAAVSGTAPPPGGDSFSADFAVALRERLFSSPYSVVVQVDEGGEQRVYYRWGVELGVYGMLF